MNRFYGLMPSNEITISKIYKDLNGLTVHIDAGPKGWTVIYADGTTEFKDEELPDTQNLKNAYNNAVNCLGKLTDVTPPFTSRNRP